MRVAIPKVNHPVVRVIADLPDGGHIYGDYLGGHFDEADLPIPVAVDPEAVRVSMVFLNDQRTPIAPPTVIQEPKPIVVAADDVDLPEQTLTNDVLDFEELWTTKSPDFDQESDE